MAELVASRDVYGKTLVELGKSNSNIVVLDADLSKSTKTVLFGKEFPDRFFDMGVAEQDMMGTAAGLAVSGKVVFVSTFAMFATGRAWEQIRTSICYPRLNVKIVASHGGITVGEDGVTHQATEDIAIIRPLPNIMIIVPCDAVETEAVIRKVAKTHGPVYVRLNRPKIPIINNKPYEFIPGKANVLREGKDVAIIACGIMVNAALQAAEELAKKKINARVINMATIKPIDKEVIIKAAKETKKIVTAEEHTIIGGLGSAVAEVLAENFPVPLARVGIKGIFAESGKPQELLTKYELTSSDIAKAAKSILKR